MRQLSAFTPVDAEGKRGAPLRGAGREGNIEVYSGQGCEHAPVPGALQSRGATASREPLGVVTFMKQTWRVPLAEFPPTNRPGRLSTIAATLGLILSSSASSASTVPVAPPVIASPAPAHGATVHGNDISWPQCPKSGGGNGLPGPMTSASFAVLGLTDGGSFRVNPCLAREVASVKTRHLWAGAYAISTYPTNAELARHGGTGTMTQRLRRVGAAQAGFNLATMARVGLQSPMVWVDVEPRTQSPWSTSADNNNAVIDGVIARYQAAGVRAGIYSYNKAWKAITGARVLPGVPTWVPVGHTSGAEAAATCAVASYAGSRPWLTQWTDDVRDYDLTCPGVTGRAARGNLLTTDGIGGNATWRALGAGTGTYTPPVRGFMGTLFAST